jgi:hypothetical protein
MRFRDRLARHLDHPIDAACGVRPAGLIWTTGICAGIGAGTGSVVGGALLAGAGGGLGVIVGYVIVGLRLRGSDESIAMALALAPDRAEVHRLSFWTVRSVGLISTIPYTDLRSVDSRSRLFELRIEIVAQSQSRSFDAAKWGSGAAPQVVEELRRRIAA